MKRFDVWIRGVVAAFIGGGASAVTSSVTASMLAPEKFNLAGQIGDFMALVGTTFIVNAVLSVMMYLKQSPLPPSENGTSRRSI